MVVHEKLHQENSNHQQLRGEEVPFHAFLDGFQPLIFVGFQRDGVGVFVSVDMELRLICHPNPSRLGAEVTEVFLCLRGARVKG